jgi:hypothetical protein
MTNGGLASVINEGSRTWSCGRAWELTGMTTDYGSCVCFHTFADRYFGVGNSYVE